MNEPRFVIQGTGRSGSMYISRVLRSSNINCGHEEYWSMNKRVEGLDGDSSWLATFDKGYNGKRFGQVRNPLQSVPSIYANELHNIIIPYLMVRVQNVTFVEDSRINAIRIWLAYTKQTILTSEYWWRVEDVDKTVVGEISSRVGLRPKGIGRALSQVSKTINTRNRKAFEWPNVKETEEAFELASFLGYEGLA